MHTLHGGPINRVVERGKCGTFACFAYAKHHVFFFLFFLFFGFIISFTWNLTLAVKFVPLMNLMQ